MTNPNDPAFNDIDYMSSGGHVHNQGYKNLTKREYFSAMAMGAAVAGSQGLQITYKEFAVQACLLADALIAELNKEASNG